MQLSKLEVCVAILEILNQKGKLQSREIEASIKVEVGLTKKCIDLLAQQGFLEKQKNHNNDEVYFNTAQGQNVLEFFFPFVVKYQTKPRY